MARALPVWLAAAWLMSLSTIGFLVVPLLFVYLPSPAMAGAMAAQLFTAQTYLSAACGIGLLLALRSRHCEIATAKAPRLSAWSLAGVLMALMVELGVAPHIIARENLVFWHRLGTGMYVVQWLCAAAVFASLTAGASRLPSPAEPDSAA